MNCASIKMWLSIAEFVTMLYVALGGSESEATQIAALIMAGAGVIGYVIAEGLADAGSASVPVAIPDDTVNDIEE